MLDAITRWRRRVGALVGGFEAGQSGRRLRHFTPSRAHLNTLVAAAGADITARARWLVRNNGYAANAIESWAGNVVGSGIKPSSLIQDAELKARSSGSGSTGRTRRMRRRSPTSMACSAASRARSSWRARSSSGSGRADRRTG